MNNIREILQSENTDAMYESWSSYRDDLTQYILESFPVCNDMSKPTLAIWGAGGCNDLELKGLAEYYRLVLIDCEKDRAEHAIQRAGLGKAEAVAADLLFYDIPLERYEEYNELLAEGAALEELHAFLSETLHEAVSTDMAMLPHFDYSVAVGLASQLNARLAAILYMNRERYSREEREDIIKHIHIMDREAVRRLCDMITCSTASGIIIGYEQELAGAGEPLHIKANDLLVSYIDGLEDTGVLRRTGRREDMIWPFAEEKSYRMCIEALKMS